MDEREKLALLNDYNTLLEQRLCFVMCKRESRRVHSDTGSFLGRLGCRTKPAFTGILCNGSSDLCHDRIAWRGGIVLGHRRDDIGEGSVSLNGCPEGRAPLEEQVFSCATKIKQNAVLLGNLSDIDVGTCCIHDFLPCTIHITILL